MRTVLIVDDDELISQQLKRELKRQFFEVRLASSGKEALEVFGKEAVDVMLLDVKLPDSSGLEILKQVKKSRPGCEVIVITGYGTQEIAVQALRRGAIDYIEKPIEMPELKAALGRAIEKLAQREEREYRNTVLVADDERDVVRRLCEILEKEGYETFSAFSGEGVLDVISKNKIDVVIADVQMPKMDGLEVLKRVKGAFPDIEVIMVTGHGDQEVAVASLRNGAIDYLQKPVDLEELLLAVERAIERIRLCRNSLYRSRELKLSSEIVSKINEELETTVEERTKELSETQVQLFQTAKLATLGEMSAGLAHEINQPLSAISLVATNFRMLLRIGKLSDEEVDSGLNDIESSIKRMSKVIQHIRTFARQDTLAFVQVDINETIESALSMLGEQLRLHEIDVEKNLASSLPRIIGEPYQLEQVWINILSNARDALDEKSGAAKGTSGAARFGKRLRISTTHDPGAKKVEVAFADNGAGMSPGQKQKIFEPFYTTKDVGKATGLGMSISYGIIESHKGSIEVESSPQVGSVIKVILPAA